MSLDVDATRRRRLAWLESEVERLREALGFEPSPSQGQDIPKDQLLALLRQLWDGTGESPSAEELLTTYPFEAERVVITSAYRVGYAAHAGYEITVTDAGVEVGDRVGGRCPKCGAAYPRQVPAGQDRRCTTCAAEDGWSPPDLVDQDPPDVWAGLRKRTGGKP